jgi:hypothetical protein
VSRARQRRLYWQVAVLAALGALAAGFCLLPALRADETDGPAATGEELASQFEADNNVARSVTDTNSTGCCDYVKITDVPNANKTIGGGEDGEDCCNCDEKWTVAKLPPPYTTPFTWQAESSQANAAAEIHYKRGAAAEAVVAWDGAAADLKFGDDKVLCHKDG